MGFQQYEKISPSQIDRGLKILVKNGVAAEVMAVLTGGAFLVALALKLGASNFQIGLLAALPTLANLFQLVSIYLLHKYANRKGITVISSICARLPLLLIGMLPFIFPPEVSLLFVDWSPIHPLFLWFYFRHKLVFLDKGSCASKNPWHLFFKPKQNYNHCIGSPEYGSSCPTRLCSNQ